MGSSPCLIVCPPTPLYAPPVPVYSPSTGAVGSNLGCEGSNKDFARLSACSLVIVGDVSSLTPPEVSL